MPRRPQVRARALAALNCLSFRVPFHSSLAPMAPRVENARRPGEVPRRARPRGVARQGVTQRRRATARLLRNTHAYADLPVHGSARDRVVPAPIAAVDRAVVLRSR